MRFSLFQISQSVVNHLNLFFDHRHTLGETVMKPHFSGQFVDFCSHNCHSYFLFLLRFFGSNKAGNHYTRKGQAAGN